MATAARYPDIADHGLIGDLQTAALVATDGTVDWFCCPRFDSPSVFASLLDADHGGYFRVGPDRDDYVTKQLYVPDTAILITTEEAAAFTGWLRDRVSEASGGDLAPPKIMYRVDGTSDLTEQTLDHFEGWRGSRPVRIGNGAADQLQLDIYGEAMDAFLLANTRGVAITHQGWIKLADFIDWLCEHWDQPDDGIWEIRGGRRDFTYGRFQTWVALDRAIRLVDQHGRPSHRDRWITQRDLVYQQVFERGCNAKAGGFTQYYGSDVFDSSLLLMSLQEIGSTGQQLGNFPQAFSHLALISAAINLDYQLDHGVGSLPYAPP